MDNKIDLNQADRETLAGLPGIGEKLADRIIEYRESGQPFATVAELAAVPGISENMVQEIEEQVTVSAAPQAEAEESVQELPVTAAAVASAGPEIAGSEQGNKEQLADAAAPEAGAEKLEAAPLIAAAAVTLAAQEVDGAEQGNEDQLVSAAAPETDAEKLLSAPPSTKATAISSAALEAAPEVDTEAGSQRRLNSLPFPLRRRPLNLVSRNIYLAP